MLTRFCSGWYGTLKKAALEVENYYNSVSLVAQTALRDAIGRASASEVAVRRNQLDEELQEVIEERTRRVGHHRHVRGDSRHRYPAGAAGGHVRRGPGRGPDAHALSQQPAPSPGRPAGYRTHQDMILGTYYLTIVKEDEIGAGKVFSSPDEAMLAYDAKAVGLHAPVKVRMEREVGGEMKCRIVDATVGRLIFNNAIPQDLGYVDRNDPEKCLDLEVGFSVGKKQLSAIIDRCIRKHGFTISTEMLDNVKALGYKHSTCCSHRIHCRYDHPEGEEAPHRGGRARGR